MLKKSLFYFFLFTHLNCYSKLFNAKELFPNGKPKYKGKYTSCVVDVINGVHIYEKRKLGKWIYYHPSGSIKKVEYHTKSKSCKKDTFKEGIWQYFNEEGVSYLEERYEKDTLIYKEIDVYTNDQLVAKISINDGKYDTINYISSAFTHNLIPNPGFETYYYKPVKIVNDGQNKIEDLIPYWNSPDNATPDYYNIYRSLNGVSANLKNGIKSVDGHSYLGLMMFFQPGSRHDSWNPKNKLKYDKGYVYSESIQTRLLQELEKGKIYCFKSQIILSQNAGLSVDKFGAYLSENAIQFKYDEFPDLPQLAFHKTLNKTNEWTTLCKVFIAKGNERFLTLGRFSKPEETFLLQNNPIKSSGLDINKAAYYLLDNIELYEVTSKEACNCTSKVNLSEENANLTKRNLSDYFEINEENKVVLRNVNFEFDKTEFRSSSLPELEKLMSFLDSNPDIKILITGHTDDSGSKSYNMDLSLKRALAIKNWLVENGIESSRISCMGKGHDNPVTDNLNEHNKSINRRVEFEIIEE